MNVALIISIYNSPDFLDKVLASVFRQTRMPEEVIVSEDGEFVGNRGVVGQWSKIWPKNSKLIHLTQRDEGNRKPLAMNKAVSKTTCEYIIFIDGDCVLRSDFVNDHLQFSEKNVFLTGRRVELSAKASTFLTKEKIASGYLEKWPWELYLDAALGKTHNLGRFFKIYKIFRKILKRDQVDDIRGCNFSVYRFHLIGINGFTNDFSGAYGEDSELEYRLKFHGIKMKSIKGAAIQFHLWHPGQPKDLKNQERLQELLKNPVAKTSNGLKESVNIP